MQKEKREKGGGLGSRAVHGRLSNSDLNLLEKVFENLPRYYPGFSNVTKR
jgi:hypothetical protein